MSSSSVGSGGGGGARDVGTVTGGMAVMNFDEKTRPYSRQDLVNFVSNYDTNFNDYEKRLVEKGLAITFLGMPLAFAVTYHLTRRLPWYRMEKAVPIPWITRAGRVCLSLAAATLPYVYVQSWFVNAVLNQEENKNSDLSFHLKRLMITQRNGMMFARTATREVTREEQERLAKDAVDHVLSNRMANRPESQGAVDVNLALGKQVMLPVAQTGYKPLPTASK